ncbi:metallophosphoesterase family protein [Novosphingobium sp.]|uniref:metallophosphoesterase family protein n=1 Tax=Novosphingobium sp. TaxID=1874826 RepID=UPI0025FA2432|nr:metallophosphoesterase family protein [Novosphingobium sp.]
MNLFRNLLSALRRAPAPTVPAGQRIYAVGDIHGRRDLFDALVGAIETDDAKRSRDGETTIILLGDLVDRGPDSAGVIDAARCLQQRRPVRILMGNHEEMMLQSFGSSEILREFLRFGGRETVLSYGVQPADYHAADLEQTRRLMDCHIPPTDRAFIAGFEDSISVGDYVFVHAGVRPGVPLCDQQQSDLRWIRSQFLEQEEGFGAVIVHGHTIFAKPEVKAGRIGIDTGAYTSGRLTALGLEGTRRWLIEAQDNGSAITIAQRSI